MDFNLDENQQMLSDSIDRFLTDKYDLPTRRRLQNDAEGRARLWREMAELGWIGAAFPEEVGGFQGSLGDVMVVMDRFGRHLLAEPYVVSAIVGGQLLLNGLSGERREGLIGELIAGELQLSLAAGASHVLRSPEHTSFTAEASGGGWVVSGRMPVVLNGARADQLLVAARTGGRIGEREGVTLFLVDANSPQVERRGFLTLDGHEAAEIVISRLSVGADHVVGQVDAAVPLIDAALDHGAAAVCAEAVGSMSHLVRTTSEYTKTREQYGAPLAKFQVLQHRMADMYIQTEMARSMAYLASLSLDQTVPERVRAVSGAKAHIGKAGKFVGYQAVQLHGGMGVTEELDVSWHYIRLTTINQLFGDQAFHLQRFADVGEALFNAQHKAA
jgi:alkylation response protein AidB-like acyl-CoA dehydrogenase